MRRDDRIRRKDFDASYSRSSSKNTPEKKAKWRKILYEDQGVPDNYVDESFLEELKKNLYIRTYHYWPVVLASGVVTQQFSSVCLFVVVFAYLECGSLVPEHLLLLSTLLTVLGYILYSVWGAKDGQDGPQRTRWDDMRTAVIFLTFGAGLSPILMTLTDTISTDTIYAMTAAMLLANLLFHDYGAGAVMVSQSLSLNAAIFASVCLASRLTSALEGFATITFAVEIFALWPALRKSLQADRPVSQVLFTMFCGVVTLVAMAPLNLTISVLFVLMHLFITFVCPAWLIGLQPYKNNIYGPWDEAVIQD